MAPDFDSGINITYVGEFMGKNLPVGVSVRPMDGEGNQK